MKLLAGISLLLLVSCNTPPPTPSHIELIESYYEGLNTSDFEQITSVFADSITFGEGEYATTFSANEYYVLFQWDSVFTPQTTLSQLRADHNKVTALVSTTSQRYAFLENNPYVCESAFTIEDGKIRTHETIACPHENRQVWESKRDTLVAWIDQHHPELSGFVHDLTKTGAEKYLKAIELYENR